MGDLLRKRAMRRLHKDMEELQNSPVANVAATPLDSDMFEWHCNFQLRGQIYHIILFFPDNYPYRSPSAEFMPPGFQFVGGATKEGRRGVQVCLSIFSDFADWHQEWANEKSAGWSPGYTVQTVLLNMISFLEDMNRSCEKYNLELSKKFKCQQCGHAYAKPYPKFDEEAAPGPSVKVGQHQITDYISKDRFNAGAKPKSRAELFGYGLIVSGPPHRPSLTTPCEFITGESFFGMQGSEGKVKSIMKEDLSFFLPLYINPNHGQGIRQTFEECMRAVGKILPGCKRASTPLEDVVLKVIPNLMAATVVEFSKGTQHTSDNHLQGYFALHRLFLWAIETYPDLLPAIEKRLENFIKSSENRSKKNCPHIGEWLMLLSGSEKYTWQNAADAYLSESWRRNVMWYVKDDSKLGFLDTPQSYRIEKTYKATEVSRKILAFQVLFLDIAMPKNLNRAQLIKRYDENLGFPTDAMTAEMKVACEKIGKLKDYGDWFRVLKLPAPTNEIVYSKLIEAVEFAINTDGYHWSFFKNAGGWPQVLKAYRETHGTKPKPDAGGKKEKPPAALKKSSSTASKSGGKGQKKKAEDGDEEKPKGKAAKRKNEVVAKAVPEKKKKEEKNPVDKKVAMKRKQSVEEDKAKGKGGKRPKTEPPAPAKAEAAGEASAGRGKGRGRKK